jgi:AcrR family transcriptional regulator
MQATAATPTGRPDPEAILPGGTAPPAEIPPEIFRAALGTFLERRRLDMRALAAALGMGRATLYRKVGNRDRLLGEVIWYLTRRALARSLDSTGELRGSERVVAVVRHFMSFVNEQPDLRRLLEAEPETALRILTSKQGPVQRGVVEALERLIGQEEERGAMRLSIDRATLAYVIVRIGEGFLYADVIADNPPDVDTAVDVVARLLRE